VRQLSGRDVVRRGRTGEEQLEETDLCERALMQMLELVVFILFPWSGDDRFILKRACPMC
jgi:hypothetical protein